AFLLDRSDSGGVAATGVVTGCESASGICPPPFVGEGAFDCCDSGSDISDLTGGADRTLRWRCVYSHRRRPGTTAPPAATFRQVGDAPTECRLRQAENAPPRPPGSELPGD